MFEVLMALKMLILVFSVVTLHECVRRPSAVKMEALYCLQNADIYSGCKTFWLMKCSSGRLGVSHWYNRRDTFVTEHAGTVFQKFFLRRTQAGTAFQNFFSWHHKT
jgi:hypothetical protein